MKTPNSSKNKKQPTPAPASTPAGSTPVQAASAAGDVSPSAVSPIPAPVPSSSAAAQPIPLPANLDPSRNSNGTFAKGHTKTGGIKKGQHQQLSIAIQNKVLSMVKNEVDSDRFQAGLEDLYLEDPKSYYQIITSLLKFCAPTLQSQSLEIQDSKTLRTIDDRLDQLMRQKLPTTS